MLSRQEKNYARTKLFLNPPPPPPPHPVHPFFFFSLFLALTTPFLTTVGFPVA
jgi:hypothetical protein